LFFLENFQRFASFCGFTYTTHKYFRLFTICVEFYMVSSNFNFFEILKFRQRWGIGVLLKNSIFQKYPKCIITYNYVFFTLYISFPCQESSNFSFFKNFNFHEISSIFVILAKIQRFASFCGFRYTSHNGIRLFTICVEFYMVSSNLNFFEILKFRQRGSFGVYLKKSSF
jgi:hypothetical protein